MISIHFLKYIVVRIVITVVSHVWHASSTMPAKKVNVIAI